MGSGEVIGDLAQGGLLARIAEPAHGPGIVGAADDATGHTAESACLNCGTALIGSHCHACGQPAHVHRTIASFFHDLAHGVFHFEGKIWRTLPLLAWQPGRLTREYIDGRRASYVSPIALFLFSVFLLFAAIHAVEGTTSAHIDTQLGKSETEATAKVKVIEAQLAQTADPAARAALETALSKARTTADEVRAVRVNGLAGATKTQNIRFRSDIPALDRLLKEGMKNPQLSLLKVQGAAYKYSWALIPLSVPFVWLLFPFSQHFGIYDHTVFVTYSLAFMSVLAVILTLGAAYNVPFVAVLLLIPPVHLYRQLKGTYALGRGGALWRTAAVMTIATAALVAFAMLIIGVGLSG